MKSALLIAIAVGLGLPKDTKEEAVKKEVEKLQGEWVVAWAEKTGKKLTNEERSSDVILVKAVVKDDTIELWLRTKDNEAKPGNPFKFTVDPTKKPKTIMLNDIPAIYSLDGDTLKVCLHEKFSKDKSDVPTSFDTNMSENWYLFVFKREKKEK